MPLKAKIAQPAWVKGTRYYSTPTEDLLKEQPGDEADDVIFTNTYGVRTIELNRPKKLNSLNGSMARKIIPRLQEWQNSQLANVVVIKGSGRAFCAGGDVAALAEWNTQGKDGQQKSTDYFGLEYKLDHLIATYSKPYVAFMDGITMGGGVGLSVHAPFRIATENTLFAMPETTIGFFPDVGASFFLPRMDGEMGTYLALTSEQLKGVDVFYHGVATHYIDSASLPDLEARLAELVFADHLSLQERYRIVDATIEEYCTGLPTDRAAISGKLREAVDLCFSDDHLNIKEVFAALAAVEKASDPVLANWAKKTSETMHTRSPTSVLVTLQQMRVGRSWNIAEAFQNEYNIAAKFMAHDDFVEGVTARLIRRIKERPQWKPNTFDQVSADQVADFFRRPASLPLINHGDGSFYKEYPHEWLSLPRERDVRKVVTKGELKTANEIVNHFVERRNGKQGVREKVTEILERVMA
ncbi:ClpP/crotonase [Lophium mytilinum]|uniref:3-hydroxyisobutyryl-CoA hydrolase n=1 Tax=Lophium mytilinum TaxID=390894 RepID=A0A6A6QDL2_9PEZI|nr:ClpP/crotonase [Lophium mytilinum]